MRPTPPEGSPLHVRHDEREIDAWGAGGQRYRLVERGGAYRLEVWELYRWVGVEAGLQAVARRVAELVRSQAAELRNVSELKRRSG